MDVEKTIEIHPRHAGQVGGTLSQERRTMGQERRTLEQERETLGQGGAPHGPARRALCRSGLSLRSDVQELKEFRRRTEQNVAEITEKAGHADRRGG